MEFTIAHAAKLGDRLAVLAPIVESACYVHDKSPFLGFQSSAARPWSFVRFDDLYVVIPAENVQREGVAPAMFAMHSD